MMLIKITQRAFELCKISAEEGCYLKGITIYKYDDYNFQSNNSGILISKKSDNENNGNIEKLFSSLEWIIGKRMDYWEKNTLDIIYVELRALFLCTRHLDHSSRNLMIEDIISKLFPHFAKKKENKQKTGFMGKRF
ncbi:hypothetical protein RhiirC2_841904 [Rhizophagus irregularis]|uniref:Uncharacterized protein n=1 Tax=Rhizophagus irregularis TaxID=588596 RepID=A0A2N1P2F4_9GLOM|nr:hypothetical protein RhiirC2_841904 [Rhizophagus irregularis]